MVQKERIMGTLDHVHVTLIVFTACLILRLLIKERSHVCLPSGSITFNVPPQLGTRNLNSDERCFGLNK